MWVCVNLLTLFFIFFNLLTLSSLIDLVRKDKKKGKKKGQRMYCLTTCGLGKDIQCHI